MGPHTPARGTHTPAVPFLFPDLDVSSVRISFYQFIVDFGVVR